MMNMKRRHPSKPDIEAAYETAIRLLAQRPHGQKELEQKLRQRGYGDPIRRVVLRRCMEGGYIDDAATCEAYCRELIRKGFGPRAVRQRLAGRGMDDKLVRSTLTTRYPQEAVYKNARTVAARKLQQLRDRFREKSELRMRLARFLAQRGFPADSAHDIIDELIDS
jgi:regulatory protein